MSFDESLARFLSMDESLDHDVAVRILQEHHMNINEAFAFWDKLREDPRELSKYVAETHQQISGNQEYTIVNIPYSNRPKPGDQIGETKQIGGCSNFLKKIKNLFSSFIDFNRDIETEVFSDYYESQYPSEQQIFFHGTLREALNEAILKEKFLFLYLHSPFHPDTATFCKNCVPAFVNFQTHFVICGESVHTKFGIGKSIRLNVTTFPAIVILFPNVDGRVHIFLKREGKELLCLNNLREEMDAFVALNQQRLAEMVRQRKELNALRTVHREIDTEYERALNEDKQREFERKEHEMLQNKIEESMTREREKLETDRKFAEKMFSQKEYQADDCLSVAIRLLNGKRISRRFSPDDTIKNVYLFALLHSEDKLAPSTEFKHFEHFVLISANPVIVFPFSDKKLSDFHLGKSVLLVQEIEDESTDSESSSEIL